MLCTIFLAEEEIVRKFDAASLARTPKKGKCYSRSRAYERKSKMSGFQHRLRKSGRSSNGHSALLRVKDYRFR